MTGLEAGIVGHDRDALLDFYVGTLRFEVTDRLDFVGNGHLVKLRRDGARLKIFFPERVPEPMPTVEPYWELAGWRYAALLFDDLDEMRGLFGRVEASAGRVVMAPNAHRPNAQAGLVADPEGNHWELLWEGT